MYRKNVANQYIYFALINTSTGLGLTGASVTAYRALDNVSQATATGTTSELGNGHYRFNLSQADTNADEGSYLFVATGASPVEKTVVFTAANPSDGAAFGLSKFADIETDTQDIQSKIPANFASLGIDGSGAIVSVLMVDELASNALTVNQAADPIAGVVWNALLANYTTANSFGARIVRSVNSNNTVQITGSGSNHIFAVLHDAEPDSIPEDAFVAGALSARVLAADAATEIATAVATTQALSRLDSMIESDGAGQFRFDTIALSMAPAGGGGGGGTDWTANERTAIRSILGIPTSGTTPTDPTVGILDEIRDQTALIQAGGTVTVSSPVTTSGQLSSPLIIGDDYLAANGRRFRWTVPLPSGYVIATSTAKFGMRYEDDEGVNSFIATGTVSDAGSGNVYLDFDVARSVTGTLRPGWYEWSVEIISASGTEITRVKSGKNAEWQEKQT
jgi:hypothetical protein